MKKVDPIKTVVIVMVLITAIIAVSYLNTRTAVSKGMLHIEHVDRTVDLPLEQLDLVAIQGTVVNGKGEERTVDAQGICSTRFCGRPASRSFQRSLSQPTMNTVRWLRRRKWLRPARSI